MPTLLQNHPPRLDRREVEDLGDHRGKSLGALPRQLEKIVDMRNPAAHTGAVARAEILKRREEIMGIGQVGVLGSIVGVKMRQGRRD